MRLIVLYEPANIYVLSNLNTSTTHFVVGSLPVTQVQLPPEVFAQIKAIDCDAIVLAVSGNSVLENILLSIRAANIQKPVLIVRNYTLQKNLPFMSRELFLADSVDVLQNGGGAEERPYLVHIETHVCDHCNLNCKACNNFAPFVRKRTCASVEQWDSDIARLANIYQIGRIYLLGGEPLLEPELTEKFIQATRKHAPTSELYIDTNGLLIPAMTDSFFETLVKNHVMLYITAYLPTMKMMPQIWDALDSHGVQYVYHKTTAFAKRVNTAPGTDFSLNHIRCGSGGCHYMRDGYISKCPDAMLIEHMDNFLGTNFRSRCDISLDEAAKDPILTLQKLNAPIDLCRYCSNRMVGIPWEPVKGLPKAEDWII